MAGIGFFCVFEGLDGSGKTTLLERTALGLQNHPGFARRFSGLTTLKEPTDAPTGREIRRRLRESTDADPAAWLELFQTDRQHNVASNIRPGIAAGRLLLQDRYFYSTAAYQGIDGSGSGGDQTGDADPAGFPPDGIVADARRRGFPEPDLLVYLELDPATALERIDRGRDARETFETRERLEGIARRYARILPATTVRLDARLNSEELTAAAVALILERTEIL